MQQNRTFSRFVHNGNVSICTTKIRVVLICQLWNRFRERKQRNCLHVASKLISIEDFRCDHSTVWRCPWHSWSCKSVSQTTVIDLDFSCGDDCLQNIDQVIFKLWACLCKIPSGGGGELAIDRNPSVLFDPSLSTELMRRCRQRRIIWDRDQEQTDRSFQKWQCPSASSWDIQSTHQWRLRGQCREAWERGKRNEDRGKLANSGWGHWGGSMVHHRSDGKCAGFVCSIRVISSWKSFESAGQFHLQTWRRCPMYGGWLECQPRSMIPQCDFSVMRSWVRVSHTCLADTSVGDGCQLTAWNRLFLERTNFRQRQGKADISAVRRSLNRGSGRPDHLTLDIEEPLPCLQPRTCFWQRLSSTMVSRHLSRASWRGCRRKTSCSEKFGRSGFPHHLLHFGRSQWGRDKNTHVRPVGERRRWRVMDTCFGFIRGWVVSEGSSFDCGAWFWWALRDEISDLLAKQTEAIQVCKISCWLHDMKSQNVAEILQPRSWGWMLAACTRSPLGAICRQHKNYMTRFDFGRLIAKLHCIFSFPQKYSIFTLHISASFVQIRTIDTRGWSQPKPGTNTASSLCLSACTSICFSLFCPLCQCWCFVVFCPCLYSRLVCFCSWGCVCLCVGTRLRLCV